MNNKLLQEYLRDPVNLHNMGLMFWINKSVQDIGIPMTVSILNTYITRTLMSMGLSEEERLQLADALYEEMVNKLLSSPDTDEEDSSSGNSGLQ
jgi:hypothetical protein